MEKKFRAWDKESKKWIGKIHNEYLCVCEYVVVLVKYAPNNSGGYDPIECRQLTNPEVDNLEIVQFTGLNDKNGKEIFEGDILDQLDTILEVKFRYGCFFLCSKDDNEEIMNPFATDFHNVLNQYEKHGIAISDNKLIHLEIIGNIHENPELTNRSK